LTNILQLTRFLDANEHAEILDEHNRIWITDTVIELDGKAGDILSLIPLTDCNGVTTENLAYPLQDAALKVGHGLGVSNIITASPARVTLSKGRLLVMLCRD